jgi:Kef-type K+ transport system membrane component KefB
MVGLGLALAFVCSALAESFGLAFIIGAYSVGLGLSRTQMAHKLMDKLQPVGDFLVPVFFASLGMLVNPKVMFSSWQVVGFGLAVTAAAVVGKLVGCGAAALPVGFNDRGAYRIGLGMLPRGEVALIVAGIGLSRQLVGEVVFGVSIMMTLLTTIIAPVMLVPAFNRGGGGRRRAVEARAAKPAPVPREEGLEVYAGNLAELIVERLLQTSEKSGWNVIYDRADEEIYLLRSGNDAAQITEKEGVIRVNADRTRLPAFKALIDRVREDITQSARAIKVEALPDLSTTAQTGA